VLKNVYLKSLRETWIPILGWGIGLGLLFLGTVAAFPGLNLAGMPKAQLDQLITSFRALSDGVAFTTAGGYLTYKLGLTMLVFCIWPLLAGSNTLRGEEDRGSMDALLSLPHTRVSVAIQKVLALFTAILIIGVIIGIFAYLGGESIKATDDFTFGSSIMYGLNLALTGAVFGAIALFISQFTQDRGSAAGVTGGLLAVFIVLDMLHRLNPSAEWISRISPIYYYNISHPIIHSYGTNFGAELALLAMSVILSGAAIWIFSWRDIGAAVALPWARGEVKNTARVTAVPASAWSLRSVYTRALGKSLFATFWWTLGLSFFAAWVVVITKTAESQFATLQGNSPFLSGLISSLSGKNSFTNATFLSALFGFLPPILMAYAITQANAWSADEESGRQELVLATPQSRLSVILARFAALATLTIAMSVVTLAAVALTAAANNFALDGGHLAATLLLLVPLGLVTAAIGYLLSGWLRAAVDTGLVSLIVVFWFAIAFVGPDLKWPNWTQYLSALYYYGHPLTDNFPVGGTLLILAVAAVALAIAAYRWTQKDIAR
jgi:ABC-2 type transport system permease protein